MRLDDKPFFLPLVAASLLLFSANARFNVSAQQSRQAQPKCPTTKVSCPDSVYRGEKLTFTTDVRGGDSQVTPTFNWTVSAGSIESGQGTATITVDTSEVGADSTVTATVDVGGFSRECGYGSTASSCTATVMKKVESRKLDEYGTLKPAEENTRLDNFVNEIQSDPTAQGYVVTYGGRAGRAGDAQKAGSKAKDYLVNKRGLDPQRVVIVNGGLREQATVELWVVPSGAQPPKAAPAVEPGEAKPASPAKRTKPKPSKSRKS